MSVHMVSPAGGDSTARDRLSQARTLCQEALSLIDQDDSALVVGAQLQGVIDALNDKLVGAGD